mgnify:CR=1 FL=1
MSWADDINKKLIKHRKIIKKAGYTDANLSRAVASTINNKKQWADPKVRKKRMAGMKKYHEPGIEKTTK